ncbi:putative n-acetyltransferase 9 [Venturia nashicola]|uniref:Putative n-acetyltransferase 9 n=1 Tax=Venturia nashicola TaxID=86259 RepID=A0A4Z1PE24_9PEZI|nr:putative n-acetyltransferase 9 [Venturia nashicola]
MKINATTALCTPKILLVPYSTHHVPQYHTWMQDPQLQKLTASEPLSIEEEYAMQKSWREDGDKLTFIACLPTSLGKDGGGGRETKVVKGGLDDSSDRMIGDVNLFFTEDDEGDEGEDDNLPHTGEIRAKQVIGEIEIMIATSSARGKGYGKAILLTFLWYIVEKTSLILSEYTKTLHSSLIYLRVKIDAGNQTSINLFEKVGFTKKSQTPNFFNEVELRLSLSEAALKFEGMQEPSIALYRLPAATANKEPQ